MFDQSIKKIILLDDYQICLILCNNHKIIYNLKPKLKTLRFKEIENADIYKAGFLKGNKVIHWSDTTEISLEEILSDIFGIKEYIDRVKETSL